MFAMYLRDLALRSSSVSSLSISLHILLSSYLECLVDLVLEIP